MSKVEWRFLYRHLLFDIHIHRLGYTRLLHGDAVEVIDHFHGALVVGDHNKLRQRRNAAYHFTEAAHIGFVEWRVHLIEQTEGRRLDEKDREDQTHCCECFFTPGHQGHRTEFFTWRLCVDFNACIEHVGGVGEGQPRFTTTEQSRENLLEVFVDGVKGFFKALFGGR